MAQGVAGVIGGKIACGPKNVACISGDGAFLMHGNEVLTAVQYKLGITWIIFVEDLYNMVNINQCLAYGGELGFCTHVQNPDFEYLAKAFGVSYFKVTDVASLNHSIINAKENNLKNECTLIEVRYDHELPLPIKPQLVKTMKDFGQTKGIKSNPYLMKAFTKTLREKV